MTKIWLCWIKGRGTPTKEHETFADAKQEAKRLAIKERRDVMILETVGWYKMKDEPVEYIDAGFS